AHLDAGGALASDLREGLGARIADLADPRVQRDDHARDRRAQGEGAVTDEARRGARVDPRRAQGRGGSLARGAQLARARALLEDLRVAREALLAQRVERLRAIAVRARAA